MIVFLRTLLLLRWGWRRRSRLDLLDIGRLRMRALPTDIDVLGHINNGIYLTLMDLGRFDLMLRAGVWQRMSAAGVYPVARSSTIAHRVSIRLWQRYTLETRIVGWDDRSVFIEQRFILRGQIAARGWVRASFIRKGEGPVPTARLIELLDLEVTPFPPSPELARWAAEVALPSTRADARSVWE